MPKRLDLLLVNPSAMGVYHKEQQKSNYPALEPPYLAALTAEFIRNHGYSVEILDANVLGLTPDQAAKEIENLNSYLTQFVVHGNQPSASSQLMGWVTDTGKKIKNSNSNTKILLSGTHPAALPELTLEEKAFDYAVKGEGFRTPLGILKGQNLNEVQGLWFRDNGKINKGPPEQLMTSEELATVLPRGAWDLLPINEYRAHDWHCLDHLDERQPYAAIYTSFGCPFDCDFCCINSPRDQGGTVSHSISFRDHIKVADEIEFLVKEHGVRNIKFIDEMFVLNKRHYVSLSNEIIKRDLGKHLNIWAYARVDTINEGYLDTLKKAGINWLVLGIESGSQHVRDGVEKGGRFGYEKIKTNVRKIQDAGIYVLGNFIFGLPDDTGESMQETLDLALELNCERANFYSAMAYPGSKLHRWAQNTSRLIRGELSPYQHNSGKTLPIITSGENKNLPIPQDWDSRRALLPEDEGGPGWIGYSQHAYETWPLPTQYLHPEQVLDFRDKSLPTYFGNPQYKEMLKRKFGEKTAEIFSEVNSQLPRRMILGHSRD